MGAEQRTGAQGGLVTADPQRRPGLSETSEAGVFHRDDGFASDRLGVGEGGGYVIDGSSGHACRRQDVDPVVHRPGHESQSQRLDELGSVQMTR